MIKFRCPLCLLKLKTGDDFSEDYLTCPGCQEELEVPEPQYDNGEMIDKYEIDMLLGQGNAGEVYLAKDVIMNKIVALKLLIDHGQIDNETQQRFLREAQTLSALEHPNIIQAINAGRYEDGFFIAMTYVDGYTASSMLKKSRDKRLNEKLILDICCKIAGAMEYAWKKASLLHRDIKPANIMIDRNSGVIYLTDLGLAKSAKSTINITSPQFTLGSPCYMSPEQIVSVNIDQRSDIYSLGASMYHLAAGQPPFHKMPPDQIILKKSTILPADIKSIRSDVPKKIERLVKFMMEHDPADRPQTWSEVQEYARGTRPLPSLDQLNC